MAELFEWAEQEFRESRVAADGSTERDHQQSGADQWAKIPAALRRPGGQKKDRPVTRERETGPPFELEYLWAYFQELSFGLSATGFGPPSITWEALRAWQDLTGVGPLDPWEARTLVQLGMLRASVQAEKKPETHAAPPPRKR